MKITRDDRAVLERMMVQEIHPALAASFQEWKGKLESDGFPDDLSGLAVLDQIIGFCIHTLIHNNPEITREVVIKHFALLYDEMRNLFDMKERPPQ